MVLDFLTWIADSTNKALVTVSTHYAALANPLNFRLDLHVLERALALMPKGITASREPRHQLVVAWILHHVLQYLTFDGVPIEELHLLKGPTFLLALAIGYRVSQIVASTCHSSFSHLKEDCSFLTLTPSPTFLAKNEQVGSLINLIKIPSCRKETHTPCVRSDPSPASCAK